MSYSDLVLKIIKRTFLMAAIVIAIGVFFVNDKVSLAISVIFGSFVSSLMFIQMAKTIKKSSELSPNSAQFHAAKRYFVRMLVYGVMIFIAIKFERFNLVALVIGVLMNKLAIFTMLFRNELN